MTIANVLRGLRPSPAFAGGHGGGELKCACSGVGEIVNT